MIDSFNWQQLLPYASLILLGANIFGHALIKLTSQLRSVLAWGIAWVGAPSVAAYAQQYLGAIVVPDANIQLIVYGISFAVLLTTARLALGIGLLFLGFASTRNALSMLTGACIGAAVGLIQLSALAEMVTSFEPLRHLITSQVGHEQLLGVIEAWTQTRNEFLPALDLNSL